MARLLLANAAELDVIAPLLVFFLPLELFNWPNWALLGLAAATKLAELAEAIGLDDWTTAAWFGSSLGVNCFGSGGDLMNEGRVGLARVVSMGVNLALFKVFRRANKLAKR